MTHAEAEEAGEAELSPEDEVAMAVRAQRQRFQFEPDQDTFDSLKPGYRGEVVNPDSPWHDNNNSQ